MFQLPDLELTPLPGETLPSILARVAVLHADYIGRKTVCRLFGYLASPSHLLPTGIARLRWSNITLEEFIYRHTGYPYFMAYAGPVRRSVIRERILFGQGSALKMALGLPAGRLGAVEQYRYCEECRKNDVRSYGVAYWHREHQLPGLLVCQVHKCTLIEQLPVGADGIRRHLFLPPQCGLTAGRSDEHSVGEETIARLDAIADFSTELLTGLPITIEPMILRQSYREAYLRTGQFDHQANISFNQLAIAVRRWIEPLSDIYPFKMLYERAESESGWVAALVHRSSRSIHPLKHIVFACAVFGNCERFISEYSQLPLSLRRVVHSHCHECQSLDEIKIALRQGAAPTAVARIYNVSVQYVQRIAHDLDLVVNYRPKILSVAKQFQLSRQLRRGLQANSVARITRVSVCTVYRVIQRDSQLKDDWKRASFERERQIRRARLTITVKKDKTSLPGSQRDMTWCRRHDNVWLSGLLKRRSAN